MFDDKYLDTYLEFLTAERTKTEVDFIIKSVGLKKTDRILDLACGHGRHSIELAKRGYGNITALDYSETFIDKAAADAANEGVDVDFVHGDMKALTYFDEFDVVITVFTTLGYFDDNTNKDVLKQINKALKPGGRFWMDNVRAESVDKRFKAEGDFDATTGMFTMVYNADNIRHSVDVVEAYDNKEQVIHTHREWEENEQKKEYDFWLHVYSIPQWEQMLSDAGFKIVNKWSDYKNTPFDEPGAHGFVFLSEKI